MQEYSSSIKRAALISATLTSFLTPFMASSINVALPSIGRDFAMDAMTLSWVSTVYLLSSAMFLVPFGKLADIHGRRRIFLSGLIIYTLSSFICGFSANTLMLISFRILQGIGSSMVFGSGVAIISSIYPPGERGRAIGLTICSVYLGLSMGPFIGGILTHSFGWRSIFFLNFPLGLIAIIYVVTNLKGEWAESKGEKLDIWGTLLYCISLVLIMFGLSKLPSSTGYYSLSGGIAVLLVFINLELKISNPVLNIKLFKGNQIFAFSNLAALINYSATFAVTFLLSFYLQYIKMLNPQAAGSILIAQPIIMASFSPLAGRLSDKIDSKIIASIGMGFTVLGLLILVFLNEESSYLYVILALIILGFGFALFSSPNTNAVMSSVDRKYLGVASATIGTMRLIGQMLSMGIAMLVISIFVGKVQISPQYHSQLMVGIRVCFLIFVVLCTAGIFASLARGKNTQ